jgi:transposase
VVTSRAVHQAGDHARKNSLFYKSEAGARSGDALMSLIHTTELNGAQPFDYLVAVQSHHAQVKENPEEWMPWDFAETWQGLIRGDEVVTVKRCDVVIVYEYSLPYS